MANTVVPMKLLTTRLIIFGRISRRTICRPGSPRTTAACTNSFWRRLSVWLRKTRAPAAQPVRLITRMMGRSLRTRIHDASTIMSGRLGMMSTMLMTRLRTSSIHPLK